MTCGLLCITQAAGRGRVGVDWRGWRLLGKAVAKALIPILIVNGVGVRLYTATTGLPRLTHRYL
jgi:hypothetical protein